MNILFNEYQIQSAVTKIADIINNKKHDEPPIFICLLNGAFMFFSDLIKQIDKCEIDFMRVKSYPNEILITANNTSYIKGKDVYVIDDICDSGNTLDFIIKNLKNQGVKSITPTTLFKRYNIEYENLIYGIELKNEYYVIGYGLDDLNGLNRNKKYIVGLEDDNN
jgi:hypoxanthine phosphoribosyltransferase